MFLEHPMEKLYRGGAEIVKGYHFIPLSFKISFFLFRPCCVESLCFILPEPVSHMFGKKKRFLRNKKLKHYLWSFVVPKTSLPSPPHPLPHPKYKASNYTQSVQ
jgi:hypothetical protein